MSVSALLIDIGRVLKLNTAARYTTGGLLGVIAYLFIGRLIDPTFTEYWWYQLFQTSLTLGAVLILNGLFVEEGGMAWPTHAIVVGATLADTLGTAGQMYDRWVPYDKLVHFASGAAFAAGGFQAFLFLKKRGVVHWSMHRIAVSAVVASLIAVGLIWETYELLADVVFSSGRVHGLGDTGGDLMADTLGAVIAVGIMRRHELRSDVGSSSDSRLCVASSQYHNPTFTMQRSTQSSQHDRDIHS